ncbi:hypothetical protein ACQR1Y_09195 [Bradyrhizobium sp. HKCCYLRH3099]|uniref:hypothetical protein n=1 Tax=unclassified Bradyrhizobium TaxID=2631580 RepID=UPI003EBE630C
MPIIGTGVIRSDDTLILLGMGGFRRREKRVHSAAICFKIWVMSVERKADVGCSSSVDAC